LGGKGRGRSIQKGELKKSKKKVEQAPCRIGHGKIFMGERKPLPQENGRPEQAIKHEKKGSCGCTSLGKKLSLCKKKIKNERKGKEQRSSGEEKINSAMFTTRGSTRPQHTSKKGERKVLGTSENLGSTQNHLSEW